MRIYRLLLSMVLISCMLLTICACAQQEEKVVINTEGMTDLQKAVVITAESFYLRGNYAQYDMGNLYDKAPAGKMERRLTGVKAPEDYTAQNTGYTDCSGFVFDVYLAALDMEIVKSAPWTKTYCESLENTILREKPAEWSDDVDIDQKIKEFTATLKPGDIIVNRYSGDTSGHTMLYVGNGMMIHSSGKSFDYKEGKENYEQEGTFLYDPISESLLKPGHKRYLPDQAAYAIVRPIDGFSGEIPEDTLARMSDMRGIKAQKLASQTYGQTVNPNDEITFTFSIENRSNIDKTLTITDTVPENTQYISGADEKDGDKLEWEIDVSAGETVEVSYKVKVSPDTYGEKIISDSFVSGIKVNCPEITVAKTLTKDEQSKIVKNIDVTKNSVKKGTMFINEIYGKEIFSMSSLVNMWDAIFDPWSMTLGDGLELSDMVPPCLYGGRTVGEYDKDSINAQKRTRYIRSDLLVVGDIVAADDELYIFTGDKLFDLNKKVTVEINILENILASNKFAVLRPSMIS